jgi:hypothetical protein
MGVAVVQRRVWVAHGSNQCALMYLQNEAMQWRIEGSVGASVEVIGVLASNMELGGGASRAG